MAGRYVRARRLLARLRDLHAHGAAPLSELVRLVAAELVSEVCSVYVQRPGEILELAATEGLNPHAVGRTRLRVGEGIVGLCAATGAVMNLPDAQNHPAFAYRPETGEEPFASMLAVPVRRAGPHAGRAGGAEPHAAPLHRARGRRTGNRRDAAGRNAAGRRRRRRRGGGPGRHGAARVRRHHADARHRHRPGRAARHAASAGIKLLADDPARELAG